MRALVCRAPRRVFLVSVLLAVSLVGCDAAGDEPFEARLVVSDQIASPPNRVVLDLVDTDKAGWVLIHADAAGLPGELLGQVGVEEGETVGATVTLSRETTDLETLHAVLHVDEGESGVFEVGVDPAYTTPDGHLVTTSFQVQVGDRPDPSLSVSDQRAEPADRVVVAAVTSAGPGWLAIREDADGAPGKVIGRAQVPNRDSTDVAVTLDRDARNDETLWAVLHTNAGAPGAFEWPGGPDVVQKDDTGQDVAASFVVEVRVEPRIQAFTGYWPYPPDEIALKEVACDGQCWIAIHEQTAEQQQGAQIGLKAVPHGSHATFKVKIDRNVASNGEVFYAVLHDDLGEVGTYEFPGADTVSKNALGDDVTLQFFMIRADVGVKVSDQELSAADTVSVSQAISEGPGWLVIREDDGAGAPGAVLGYVAIKHAYNDGLTVTLSRPALDGETLWAVSHKDRGEQGTFEFPGPDEPFVPRSGTGIAGKSFVVTLPPPPAEAAIAAVDQEVADPFDSVVVAQVDALGPSWVVIREDDGAGAPGLVLGQTAVGQGTSNDVAVTLSRPIVDGETLWAVLHVDEDPVDTFGWPDADPEETDLDGMVVAASFVATTGPPPLEPAVTVADQTIDPFDVVTVASVTSSGPGWVTVFDDAAGAPGAELGHAAVADGTTANVAVQLSRDALDGELLHVALYVDAGTVDTYEVPDPDVPALDSGGLEVTGSFTVTLGVIPIEPAIAAIDQVADPEDQVVVASATSDGPGWVVIHEDAAGSPGAVIGQASVPSGDSAGVAVDLSRSVVHGETLYAMLHVDAGTLGTFEPTGADVPATDTGGATVVASFVVSRPPQIAAADQTADPANQVVVAEAVSAGAGFAVIHEDAAGSPGAVIGSAALSDGVNSGVVVTLTRDAVDGETLYAMLHTDAGVVGTYEPGTDIAVVDGGGQPIVAPFVVTVVPVGPIPSLSAVDQTLSDLSTVVTAGAVTSVGPGWVVVHEDAAGSPGAVIGFAAVSDGDSTAVPVTLDRPLADQEVVHVMLHEDLGTVGTWEPGIDAPADDGSGTVVTAITVTVPAGTPAVRVTFAQTTGTWIVSEVEPAAFGTLAAGPTNPTLTLQAGWTYAFVNTADGATEPFELITQGATPAEDVVLLSQAGGGTMEGDATIGWTVATGTVTFAVSTSLAAAMDGYRSGGATDTARGDIVVP